MSRKSIMGLIIILLLTALISGCGGGKASSGRGQLQGTITYVDYIDTEMYITNVNNAKVTISGDGLPSRSAYSGNDGQYLISRIQAGTYNVTADFSTATNLPNWEWVWSDVSLNGGPIEYINPVGDFPNATVTLGNVVIADDTTTTLDFSLYGY